MFYSWYALVLYENHAYPGEELLHKDEFHKEKPLKHACNKFNPENNEARINNK